MKSKHLRFSDLRGAAKGLVVPAIEGVTRIVEGVHQSVWSTIGVPGGDAPGETRGLTGLVYKSLYAVNRSIGVGIDTVLAGLEPVLESVEDSAPGSPQREAFLAALNGVMGDRLAADQNPLATSMTFRSQGEATGKVLLLIHGLCRNDLQWRTQDEERIHDHGEVLADSLGYTPVYLRYNTGLRTLQNGRMLADKLEQLTADWPVAIEEIAIVAHSMGGLVTRSAIDVAEQESLRWLDNLKKVVFLGTPHLGAPLEQAGHWLDVILGSTPYSAPFTRLSRLRSAGIKDLRDGTVAEHSRMVPLPEGVACYAVAATSTDRRSPLKDRLVGDGLVPLQSALGQHGDERRCLKFSPESQWVAECTNHMQLLSRPEVAQQMIHWLAEARPVSEKGEI